MGFAVLHVHQATSQSETFTHTGMVCSPHTKAMFSSFKIQLVLAACPDVQAHLGIPSLGSPSLLRCHLSLSPENTTPQLAGHMSTAHQNTERPRAGYES